MARYSVYTAAFLGRASLIDGPAAVSDLVATKGDHDDKVVLTFKEVDAGVVYEVWAGSTGGGAGSKIAEVEGTGVEDADMSLDVQADALGDVQDVLLTAPTLTAPSELNASDGSFETKIVLSYLPGFVDEGAIRYYWIVAQNAAGGRSDDSNVDYGYRDDVMVSAQVWWCATEEGEYAELDDSESSPYEHTGLAASTTKFYKIRLETAAGEFSDYTAVEAGSTGGVGVAAPDAPEDLAATAGTYHDKVVLTWTEAAGATAYEIWSGPVDESVAPAKIIDVGAVATANVTASNDALLTAPAIAVPTGVSATQGAYLDKIKVSYSAGAYTPGASRRFWIKSVGAGGTSGLSNPADGYRGGAVSGNEIQGSPDGKAATYAVLSASETGAYNHTGLSAGKVYYYKVLTKTSNGLLSNPSDPVEGSVAVTGSGLYTAAFAGWTSKPKPWRRWAFSVLDQQWRQLDTSRALTLFAKNNNGDLIVYDGDDGLVYSFSEKEAVGVELLTQVFPIGAQREEIIRFIIVTYRSETPLTLSLYVENQRSAVQTYELPLQRIEATFIMMPQYRAKKFQIGISGGADSMTSLQINKIFAGDQVGQ